MSPRLHLVLESLVPSLTPHHPAGRRARAAEARWRVAERHAGEALRDWNTLGGAAASAGGPLSLGGLTRVSVDHVGAWRDGSNVRFV